MVNQCISTLYGHNSWISSVDITSIDKLLFSGSDDETIKMWCIGKRKILRTFIGHTVFVRTFVITQDSKYIISGSGDNTIKIWNIQSGEVKNTLIGHRGAINCIKLF